MLRVPACGRCVSRPLRCLFTGPPGVFLRIRKKMSSESAIATLLPMLRPLSGMPGFEDHIALCAGVAIGRKPHIEAQRAAIAAGLTAETQSTLVAFFLEAARTGVAQEELAASLASVMPADRASAVAAIAHDGRPTLRSALESLSLRPEELVDVRWSRASVAAASREQPRSGGTPVYTITLSLRSANGAVRPLQFAANVEELHDLVSSIKSAVRQVEREVS